MEENFNQPEIIGTETAVQPAPPVDTEAVYKEAKHSYSFSLLNIMLYGLIGQLLVGVVFLILKLTGFSDIMSKNLEYVFNFVPMYFIAFPIFWLIGKAIKPAPPKQYSMKPGQFVIALIMCFAFMVSGALIGNIINLLFGAIFGFQIDSSALNEGILGEGSLAITIFAVLGAPIIEELIFRKFLIDRVRKYGEGTAILMSGIMFGLFHGNFSQCFFAAMLGMFFAFIYIRTGKIRYTIALHMIINFCGSVISGAILRGIDFEGFLELAEKNDFSGLLEMLPQLIPLLIFVTCEYGLALAGLILLIVNRKKFRLQPAEVPMEKAKLRKAAWLNVGCILLLIFCLVLFVITGLQLIGKLE